MRTGIFSFMGGVTRRGDRRYHHPFMVTLDQRPPPKKRGRSALYSISSMNSTWHHECLQCSSETALSKPYSSRVQRTMKRNPQHLAKGVYLLRLTDVVAR